jgi:ligand-binding SRPBCC domain-containing protein
MTTHELVWEQRLPRSRAEIFPFFADAFNLQKLTPPWLDFKILTPAPIVMQVGAHIDYQLRVHGIPLRWRTQITGWEPPTRFVDEQLRGPYRQWRHTHIFETTDDGGTLCRDVLSYAVLGGSLVNRLLVQNDVEKIFAYRREILQKIFGSTAAANNQFH